MAMAGLPKWLLPAGLAVGTLALVFSQRRPSPEVGDVVGVPAARLLSGGGPVQLPVAIPQGYRIAVQVSQTQGDNVSGEVVGYVDPATNELVRLNAPVGVGPVSFDKSEIKDIFRGGRRL